MKPFFPIKNFKSSFVIIFFSVLFFSSCSIEQGRSNGNSGGSQNRSQVNSIPWAQKESAINQEITRFENVLQTHKYKNLEMCACARVTFDQRVEISRRQAQAIYETHNINTPLRHVSLGAGHLLQAYMLASLLLTLGYQDITIYAIDPQSKKLTTTNADDQIAVRNNFLSALNAPTNVTVRVEFFDSVDEFLQTKTLANSFDMIDMGGGYQSVLPKTAYNDIDENWVNNNIDLINRATSLLIHPYRGFAFEAHKSVNEINLLAYSDKNPIDHSKAANAPSKQFVDDLQAAFAAETNLVAATRLFVQMKQNIIDYMNPDNQGAITDKDWLAIFLEDVSFLSFAKLVKYSKANDQAVIFELDDHVKAPQKIKRYFKKYDGYIDALPLMF